MNTQIDDLVRPTSEIARTIGAVAKGDLDQSMELEVDANAIEQPDRRAAAAPLATTAYIAPTPSRCVGRALTVLESKPGLSTSKTSRPQLVTNAVALQNVVDQTQALHTLKSKGVNIRAADLAILSPYATS